jgi:class 3 adenylate cyclase
MAAGVGGDERKVATVLFADLAGSTAIADGEDPERVRARLERFYEAMQAEIEFAGGTIEKFAGDAVMAVFGAPTAQEDHPERALHAALAMRQRLHELFGGELGLRIGVNSGDVVTGAPRESSSFVSGAAVNVAARLEEAAAAGETLVGERIVAAVRGAFEFDDAREREVRRCAVPATRTGAVAAASAWRERPACCLRGSRTRARAPARGVPAGRRRRLAAPRDDFGRPGGRQDAARP